MNQFDQQPQATVSDATQAGVDKLTLPAAWDKRYHGVRCTDGTCGVWVEEDALAENGGAAVIQTRRRALPVCLEIREHSPTGFGWGYAGSGPAQLALALLVDALGDAGLAQTQYQTFKHEIVSGWTDTWQITAQQIQEFVVRASADVAR